MDKPSRHLIYNFCEPKDVAGVIASWGFLAGQINFGQNINKAIANNGPLTQKAKVRGLEIYREI